MTTIADLAVFAVPAHLGYEEAADYIVREYRFERATIFESDVHDEWSRVGFVDGSELVVRGAGGSKVVNARAIDWAAPDALARAAEISKNLTAVY